MKSYLLGVGDQGKERLHILNELVAESSHQLLLNAGLSKENNILEIGCGTGNMTCWLAEHAEVGHVYALDVSKQQIALARQQATAKNINNVTFIEGSVFDLDNLPLVDFIYVRFVLMHVKQPYEALQTMLRFLKPGGYLVCEESTNSITSCYPYSPVFHQARKLLLELGEKKGLDFDVGEKLYSYFQQLNLKNILVNFIQPIYQTKRQKLLIPLLVAEAKDNYIRENIASENEIEELLMQLHKFIEDDNYLVSFCRMTQIYARAPVYSHPNFVPI